MNREEAARKNLEGLKLLGTEKYDEAIRMFNEAIEIDAEYTAPWLNRSEANRELGREAEANADRERWVSLMQAARAEEARQRTEAETLRASTVPGIVKMLRRLTRK